MDFDFTAGRIRESLAESEKEIADLLASGAQEEALEKARQCRDRLKQMLDAVQSGSEESTWHYSFVR